MTRQSVGAQNQELCNFTPEVLEVVNLCYEKEAEPIPHVRMRLVFRDGSKSKVFMLQVEKLEKLGWTGLDIKCRFSPEVSSERIKRYLANTIRSDLVKVPQVKEYRLERAGMNMIAGEHVFCTGGSREIAIFDPDM